MQTKAQGVWKNTPSGSTSKIIYILVSIAVVTSSGSVYQMRFSPAYEIAVVTVIAIAAAVLMMQAVVQGKLSITKRDVLIILGYACCVAVLPLGWGGVGSFYLYICVAVMPFLWIFIYSLLRLGYLSVFIKVFVYTITAIAGISLLFWLLGPTLQIIRPNGGVVIAWGNSSHLVDSYYNIYFVTQGYDAWLGNLHLGVRNSAIYGEAPICCFMFIAASCLNELSLRKTVVRALLVLAILSTLTTTGYLYLLLYAIIFVWRIQSTDLLVVAIKWLSLFVGIAGVCYTIPKILNEKASSGSGMVRAGAMQREFGAFLNSPLWGLGFNQYTNGSSNSLTSLLADGGVLLWILFYWPLLYAIVSLCRRRRVFLAAYVVIFSIVFAITVVHYTPMYIISSGIIALSTANIKSVHIKDYICHL